VEPLDRLRSARRGVTVSAEALAQHVAERAIDLVLQAIDINAILAEVDLNALLKNVDLNQLIEQVDVNAVLDHVDLNDVISHIDMEKLVEQTDLGAIIARSTGGIATEALDAARSGTVGLDQRVDSWVTRLLRLKGPRPPAPRALLDAEVQP
jgi:hypothetical protein